MSLAIVGYGSRISYCLRRRISYCLRRTKMPDEQMIRATYDTVPLDFERYFFAAGVMHGRRMSDLTHAELHESLSVNFLDPVSACNRILGMNPNARICVIGSESAYLGSYDEAYAHSKAALHMYVERKKCSPKQQLVCISPGIIVDTGMTQRRNDTEYLRRREAEHPKKRFLNAREVAHLAYHLLYVDQGYICNTVIRMNGGEHLK